MPNIASAKKALRQSERRHKRNLKKQGTYKKAIKDLRKSVASKQTENLKEKLSLAYKALDKAAKTKVIKKGKVDRLKSRLAHLIAKSSKTSS